MRVMRSTSHVRFFFSEYDRVRTNDDIGLRGRFLQRHLLESNLPKLPINMLSVEDCQRYNAIYVDKTEFVHKLITQGRGYYLFLRPRRFGKSFFLNTVASVLKLNDKGIFENYTIGRSNYEWKARVVLQFVLSRRDPIDRFKTQVRSLAMKNNVVESLQHENSGSVRYFEALVHELNGRGETVVVLVDEYDLPFECEEDTAKVQAFFLDFYATLKGLRDTMQLEFALLTGCNKVPLENGVHLGTTYGITSLTNELEFDTVCGFTDKEMKHYFHKHVERIAEHWQTSKEEIYEIIENWYDGYHFIWNSAERVYNPISVLQYLKRAIHNKKPVNHWIATQDHPNTVIEELIAAKVENNLPVLNLAQFYSEAALLIHDTAKIVVDGGNQKPKNVDLKKRSLESLLFQNGYLTIADYNPNTGEHRLRFPNMEVVDSFINANRLAMQKSGVPPPEALRAKKSLKKLDIVNFIDTFNTFFRNKYYLDLTARVRSRQDEGLLKALLDLLLTLDDTPDPDWTVKREVKTRKRENINDGDEDNTEDDKNVGNENNNSNQKKVKNKGFIDFLILVPGYIIIIECKYGKVEKNLIVGEKQALSYEFPEDYSTDGRIKVWLVFDFDAQGIFQWRGLREKQIGEDGYPNGYVRLPEETTELVCRYPDCKERYESPQARAAHERVHQNKKYKKKQN